MNRDLIDEIETFYDPQGIVRDAAERGWIVDADAEAENLEAAFLNSFGESPSVDELADYIRYVRGDE